jgi:hypothetical protein
MSFKHTKKNSGVDGLLKRVKESGTVDIGIIDAGGHDNSSETVASIAYKHEFGIGVPERSFMRTTMTERKKEIINLQETLLKKIQNGDMDIKQALGILGRTVSGFVSKKIVDIKSPPNSPATLKAKKPKTNPLIDTGQMKNSVTWEVN